MAKPKNPIQMAVIGAPHGIKGEVRVKTFTGDPLALGDYGPLHAEDGRRFTLLDLRPAKEVVVARFKEITDRSAAEAVTGTALYVDRSMLPDDLDEDEFYHADLVGLSVKDETGEAIGKVASIQNFGGGDIVEVKLAGGRAVMVPFTLAAIPTVSVTEGFVQLDSAAAGLIGNDEEDAEDRPLRQPKGRPRGSKSAGGNR
ncbi:ribosome maturation factor RimM [Aquamicrobium sp. LC103]|uniref:ribosome maturation factor RimM n=1 Tax=Aquamicrobium sp. LC103 TaxID=1120658 RepID=UPI00063E8A20|nr:ribosome maturation factor RimM [Aquamicrobium sp. LC103]TKT82848.1 ribosome maturation factor RimM [Aquamicrobium sp. LC103]